MYIFTAFGDDLQQNLFRTGELAPTLRVSDQSLNVEIKLLLEWFHFAIPLVFDCVVAPARDKLTYGRPSPPEGPDAQSQDPVLVQVPGPLSNSLPKVVVPSFPALLSRPARKTGGYLGPLGGALLGYFSPEEVVLFPRPNTLPELL